MRSIWKRVRGRRAALVLAVAAMSVAGPVSGASAAVSPFGFFGGAGVPAATFAWGAFGPGTSAGAFNGGPQNGVSNSGCGQNRPAVVGGTGSTEQIACGTVLAFIGPAIGQISSVVGPTIIGSTVMGPVIVSSGAVVNTVP
jgi:hypothetical protein